MMRVDGDARVKVTITLNGRAVSGWAESRTLLCDFLRQTLGETGTHVGCEHGVCGACTIRLDGVPARSCLALAVQADGRRVDTVEGLAAADGTLNPLQAAFRKHHALQCGFCTSGLLMSLSALFDRDRVPTEAEIRDTVGGHLCRCTGYAGIMAAAREVAASLKQSGEKS